MIKLLNKSLYDRIEKLPDDIKTKIYIEYIEPVIKKKQLIYVLRLCNRTGSTYKSQELLIKIIKTALSNENICKYLIKTCKHFDSIYYQYSNNTLGFELISDKYEKFAISLLLITYH